MITYPPNLHLVKWTSHTLQNNSIQSHYSTQAGTPLYCCSSDSQTKHVLMFVFVGVGVFSIFLTSQLFHTLKHNSVVIGKQPLASKQKSVGH